MKRIICILLALVMCLGLCACGGTTTTNKDNVKVDVHNPEYTLKIEIREEYTYIYSKEVEGAGG